jgi:hypothetical protein
MKKIRWDVAHALACSGELQFAGVELELRLRMGLSAEADSSTLKRAPH